MKGHLRRCRCASGAHVHTEYAPLRCSLRLASDAFLNRLRVGSGWKCLRIKSQNEGKDFLIFARWFIE